jgi:long-chain fatty acid transport protein
MRQRLLAACGVLLAGSLAAGEAFAQGGSVFLQSACASGRAGTGVASPCADGSSVLYNPAGLALRPGAFSLGIAGAWTQHTFAYDLTDQSVQRDPGIVPIPQAYMTGRLGNFGVGVGVFAPYGGGLDWPVEFEGRFMTYDQTTRAIYVQPTLSFAVVPGALSVGAGATFARGSIDVRQRADLSEVRPDPNVPLTFGNLGVPRGTDFADVNLAGSGWGTGWHVGVLLEPVDWISVGARYMHRVTTELEGDATFRPLETGLTVAPGSPFAGPPFNVPVGQRLDLLLQPAFQGPLADQGVQTSITWPEQAVVGVHLRPVRNLSLLFDYHYFGWSTWDQFPIDFQGAGQDTELALNYNNAEAFRFGAEYGAQEGLRVRAGYVYNTAASPPQGVTPFLPEGERDIFTAGLGFRLFGAQLDAFYQFIDQVDRRGRVRAPLPGQDVRALNIGVYSLDAHTFGVTFALQPRFLGR